jgi:hypothetical protein
MDRLERFENCIDEGVSFGEPVPEFQHSRNLPLVCFIVVGRTLIQIGQGRRGVRAGTDVRRLNIAAAEKLSAPIAINRIIRNLPTRVRHTANNRLRSGGLLPPKTFEAVIEVLRELAPQSRATLDLYSMARTARIRELPSEVKQNLAYQKEAVLTALAISGIDRHAIQEWMPPAGEPRSFLDGLPNTRLREDPMIVNDMMKVPGFELIQTYPYNAALFESERERLTIIVANRLPLEEQTGADLIYYNETFQSFVMIQYKAMESESDSEGQSHAVFRLPSVQLDKEIARMDSLLNQLKAITAVTGRDDFRLNENPFFLKLCPRIIFNPDTIGMVSGMYLPLDYFKILQKHPDLKGPRSGRVITFENARRHFDNSEFINVVAKAWVGTTPGQSAVLTEVIRQTLASGKAVALAVKSKVADADERPRIGDVESDWDDLLN